jgi:SlyX protein
MRNMSSELNARIEELESRLAFQDDLIENLNEVITRHDRDFVRMTEQLRNLSHRISELADAGAGPGISSEHEIPPHY